MPSFVKIFFIIFSGIAPVNVRIFAITGILVRQANQKNGQVRLWPRKR